MRNYLCFNYTANINLDNADAIFTLGFIRLGVYMLNVVRYDGSDEARSLWDDFVVSKAKANIFFMRKFLSYHKDGKFTDHSLMINSTCFQKESLVALLPAVEILEEEFSVKHKTLYAHPGSSMAALIHGSSFVKLDDLVESVINYAMSNRMQKIVFRLPCLFYNEAFDQGLEYILYEKQFTLYKRELNSVVFLNELDEDVVKSFSSGSRTSLRKAIKLQVKVERSGFNREFYEILENNLSERSSKPAHSYDELEHLSEIFPDKLELWQAYLDDRVIAGVHCWRVNKDTVLTFYIAQNYRYQEYRPMNLLLYKIIEFYRAEGFRFLDLGTVTLNGKINYGLAKFKENFKAKLILKNTLVWRQ